MYSHTWNCDRDHSEFDCPRTYPSSNVRVITAFDRHVQQAMAIANQPGIDLAIAIRRHPAGKAI